jgi:hypothetical protein
MKIKTIPLSWLEWYEADGWSVRGYEQFVCGIPKYAEVFKEDSEHEES